MTDAKDQAQSLFLNALEIATDGEREAYVAAECGDDRELRGEVEQLLDHAKRLGRFLNPDEDGALATVDLEITEKPGESIGSYKLLQKIGEGGFGVVYMAEQKQPVRRKVALKIIKLGMDTKEVVARFEAERQALALMDHPNIARVLDAGATETGRPYFVMELIKGKQLTEYCDQNELSTHERLELFVTVCNAVQHAHQRGVIHRDLKPSNVMVTLHDGHPVPKVIDFGVSKALSQQLTEKTLFTNYGQMVGTPQYMSPEQAEMSGLDIDTRSDIYSLGVLLYELLTGTTPLDGAELRKAGYAEMQRLIREVEPQKPSTRLSTMGGELTMIAKHRSADARNLGQSLRGDLDWIVMKSLSKERARRYGSASGFAEDVSRYLSDEPIEARPPSTLYRCGKWMRRNKAVAAFVSAIAIGLLVGVAGLTLGFLQAHEKQRVAERQQQVAEQQRQRAVDGEEKEKQARKELQQTAAELDEANRQLSMEGARLAFEKGNALVSAGNSQEGLLWLARALEQTPDDEQTLEEAIRFQYATVAATLPVPLRIFAPGTDERFDHIKVNRKRDRLLAAVSGAREEFRVWSLVTGKVIATIPLDGPVTWCDFSADGAKLFAATQGVLKQYDVSSKAAVGISVKLPPQIRILEIRPDGKQALVGVATEETESRFRGGTFAPRSGAFAPRLFDLATGDLQPPLLGGSPRQTPRYTRDGKWVIMKQFTDILGSRHGRSPFSLKRVHSDNGAIDEEWSIDNVSISAEISVSPDGGKLLVISLPITTEDASQGAMPTRMDAIKDEIKVFDLETAEQEFVPIKTDLKSAAAALSSDGEHIVTLSWAYGIDKSLSLWRSRTGQRVVGPLPLISSQTRGDSQTRVILVAGDRSVITVGPQGAVQWRLPAFRGDFDSGGSDDANAINNEARRRFSTLDAAVMLADGHTVAGVVTDGRVNAGPTESTWNSQIRHWDLDQKFLPTGRITAVLKAERATVSPDGTTFVTAAKGRIHRWRLPTGEAIGKPIRQQQSNVVRLQVSGNGKVLMCQTQRTLRNWRQVNRAVAYYWIGAGIRDGAGGVEVHTVLADTPAERAGLERGVILYAADLPVQTMSGFVRQIADVGASPLPLVIRRGDKRLNLAFTPAVKPADVLRGEFALYGNGQLTFYSMETGERLNSLEIPIQGFPMPGPFKALGAAISPDGLTVVTTSRYDSQHFTLQLWDMKTGRPRGAATRSLGEGRQVLFSPDGMSLAVIGTAQIELWDTRRLSSPATRIQHPGWRILTVAFSDDGSKLATLSGGPGNVSIHFWGVATGRQIGSPIPVQPRGSVFATRIVWGRLGERLALVRPAGPIWFSLPQTWDGKKSEVTRAAAAMAGCWLDPRQDIIHPLESVDWQRRLSAIAVQDGAAQTESTAAHGSLPWQSSLKAAASAIEGEDLEAAEQSLEQAVATAPREAVISWLEDEICRSRSRPLTGEPLDWYCRQLLKQDEANYVANQRRVVGLLGEGKLAEAEESFGKATRDGQRELALEQFFILASEMDSEQTGQATTKEWLLDQILRLRSTHTQSRLLRTVLHIGAGRHEGAKEDLDQLTEQLTATDLAEEMRLYAKQLINRFSAARVRIATRIYREITKLVPDNRDYWYELAFTHARLREWKEAEKAFRKTIDLEDPKSSRTYLKVAAILVGYSDRTSYKEFCQRTRVQFNDGSPLEQFHRFEASLWAPDVVTNPKELVEGIRPHVGVSPIWDECGLGIAYHRAGQPQDAIKWLTKVVENSRSTPLAIARRQSGLALVHQQLGDIDKVQQHLDRARKQRGRHLARRSQEDFGGYWLGIRILDVLCEEAEGHLTQEKAETANK